MKARVKETGEIIEVKSLYSVTYSRLDCNGKIAEEYDDDEIELLNNEKDKHWQGVRERAAIAAMQGVMKFFGSIDYDKEEIAKLAVEQADALIEQLKKRN